MTRLTVTLTEDQAQRLRREAEAKRITVSELVRDAVDEALRTCEERRAAPPAFLGIIDVELPYSAADIDEELAKIVAEAQ